MYQVSIYIILLWIINSSKNKYQFTLIKLDDATSLYIFNHPSLSLYKLLRALTFLYDSWSCTEFYPNVSVSYSNSSSAHLEIPPTSFMWFFGYNDSNFEVCSSCVSVINCIHNKKPVWYVGHYAQSIHAYRFSRISNTRHTPPLNILATY